MVELFSWWVAAGEADALDALIDVDKQRNPGQRVYNAAADSGEDARATLKKRLAEHDPPDLFQENAALIRSFVENDPGSLTPLNDLFKSEHLLDVVFPELLHDVKVGDDIVAMPVNIHRENTVYYNPALFTQNKVAVPTSTTDLLDACQQLKAAGVVPIATAYEGWVQRVMFQSLAASEMGVELFRDYLSGKTAPDLPELHAAIDVYATIVENYVNDDAGDTGFGWTNAAQALLDGKAAMYFHGDWAKGYLVESGGVADVDFSSFASPGTDGLFLYNSDVFALPVGAKNETGAIKLLTTVASVAGQEAFNRIKGSSPIRDDVNRSAFDSTSQRTLDDLTSAKIRLLVKESPTWDAGFEAFTKDHDQAALLKVLVDNPPQP